MRTQVVLDWLNSPYFYIGLGFAGLLFSVFLWYYMQQIKQAKDLAIGPSSQFQLINNITIHYQIMGKGQPLLLLHGIAANTFTWRLLAPLLARHYQVIVVDIPGFGRSTKDPKRTHGLDEQAEVLTQFCNDLGLKNIGLIGSSMGGAIALWMAKLHPEKFKKIAVLAPAVSSQMLPVELARLSGLFHSTASLLVTKTLVRSIIKLVVTNHKLITDEVVRQYQRPFIEEPKTVKTFFRATSIISDTRLPHELASIKAEILIIYGAKDKMVPKVVMNQLREVLPNAKYIEHETAGHHPMEDEPEWLSAKLREYF